MSVVACRSAEKVTLALRPRRYWAAAVRREPSARRAMSTMPPMFRFELPEGISRRQRSTSRPRRFWRPPIARQCSTTSAVGPRAAGGVAIADDDLKPPTTNGVPPARR
jgi:hypothetical protein